MCYTSLKSNWTKHRKAFIFPEKEIPETELRKYQVCVLLNMSRDMTKPTKRLCAQQRLRSAWASAQSDRSLRCALNG